MTKPHKHNPSSLSRPNQLMKLFHGSVLVRYISLTLAWLVVWQVGRVVEYTNHASVWFPAAGFTFSCLLVLGKRAFLPVMTGAIIVTIWNVEHYQLSLTLSELIWAGFLFGLAHIIPYWYGASLVSRLSFKQGHSTPQLIVTFLLVAGISAFIVTVLVILSLVATNQMPVTDVSKTLLPFWVGDMAGVVVLAPLFSGILLRYFANPNLDLKDFIQEGLGTPARLLIKIGLNIVLIIITMFLAKLTGTQESSFAIFFLALTHMWIATTESPKFNVFSLAISSILIVLLVHFFDLMDHVMVYQFAINVIAANALFGIAIPQLQAHNKELKHMVFTDALTQVSSRSYMLQRAELEIAQSHAEQLTLSLVVLDLDNFKYINDHYGHHAGDQALQQVCAQAKKSIRRNDVMARFGGDEFVLLLPGLKLNEAEVFIERIKQAINQIKIGGTMMSSSFGMAELKPTDDFKALFHRADQALYVAKNQGGNQISFADSPQGSQSDQA